MDKIKDMTKITLNEGDVLVARINRDNMSNQTYETYAASIKNTLKTYFLSNSILVTPSDISLAVIAKGEYNGTPTITGSE